MITGIGLHGYEGARLLRRSATAGAALVLVFLIAGCAGGAAPPPGPPGQAPVEAPGAGGSPPEPGEFNVTIYTASGPLYVDKLELEFNRRRGIHAFYGFFPEDLSQLVTVQWADLERIDIFDTMPRSLFDQAILGREAMNLRNDQAFETRLIYLDQSTVSFFALIPKLRGERNFEIWEQTMTGNALGVEYIEFKR